MCAGTTRTPASAKGSKVGDLMVEGTYIFDCEVFAYDWLFDFKDVVTGEHISIWNDNDAVIAFMERDPFLGGFNNKHYDNFILKAVMCGFTPEEVKKVNDLIIQEELSGWDIPSLKEYRVFFDSFDLRDPRHIRHKEESIAYSSEDEWSGLQRLHESSQKGWYES